MKKIICIYGNTVYYGHERSNVQVFNLLFTEGFDLMVVTNKRGIAPEAAKLFEDKGIKQESIVYPDWADMRKPFKMLKILKYTRNVIEHNFSFYKKLRQFNPDYIYIANDFMYLSLLPTFIFSNKKIIYRLGDAPVTGWKPFKILWEKYIIKRTDTFICISVFIKEKLALAGRKINNRDIVIYNYPPERSSNKHNQLPFPLAKGLTYGYLGQLIDIKGVELFIDAAITLCKRNYEVFFQLAGDLTYSEEYAQGLINKVMDANLQNRIIFLGSVENIKDFFSKIDILVTPSVKEEPLGNVIVEAKSYNTPSIIFNSGGMPELIKHKHNGFICSESTVAALETAMQYYIENTDLIAKHGKNAFDSIKELGIGFSEYRKKWLSVFDSNI
jgi:glycosyltransferase involved in cell wall biosynthesis